MKWDAVYGAGCTVLFFSGGLIVNSLTSSPLSGDFFNAVSAVASMATAYIAWLALKTWKGQFQHAKLSEALERAVRASDELRVIKRHFDVWYDYHWNRIRNNDSRGLENLAAEKDETYEAWVSACRNFASALDDVKLYLSVSNLPPSLHNSNYLFEVYNKETLSLIDVLYADKDNPTNNNPVRARASWEIRQEVLAAFQDIRLVQRRAAKFEY
ncbi:hypothetical protein QEM15_002450 [Pseudomonas putida]|nr:hypothetical protein [Pseudomonas putida]